MAQASARPADFNRAFGDAKKQASGVADAFSDAAQDVYGQARDSTADVLDTANTAARKTVGSFEPAIRNTIETQPYTAAAIALGIGFGYWAECIGHSKSFQATHVTQRGWSGRGKPRPDLFVR